MNSSGLVCVFSGRGDCEGRLERHHCCEKRWIKDRFPHGGVWDRWTSQVVPLERGHSIPLGVRVELEDLLDDKRNLLPCCSKHHEAITNHRRTLDPPASVWEFAAETGLTGRLEKAQERAA